MISNLISNCTNDFQDLKDAIKINIDINKSLIASIEETQMFTIERHEGINKEA